MRRILLIGLAAAFFMIILYACSLGRGSTATQNNPAVFGDVAALQLNVQVLNAGDVFNTVGQQINYQYTVSNTGTAALVGPVTITDDKNTVTCPDLVTVGNNDGNLDPTESINCAASYAITQADLNAGSVTNTATASLSGTNSNTVPTTVKMTLAQALQLTALADPTTYNQANQVITFTYTIKNTGTTALGPAQFVIHDDRMGALNCGATDTSLAAGQTLTCTATYTTTDGDAGANKLTFSTTVSGGGAVSNQPASTTVTNTATGNPSNYTPGSTIQHQVNPGEWMLQIARCYGADFNAVRNANPQVIDPDKIWPVQILTIPNIGSNGHIYGPPCVTYYTVKSGDTWNSIAQTYNADPAVLSEANKTKVFATGVVLKIPLNSAGQSPVPATQPPPTSTEPIRINFPSGSDTVTLQGTVTATKGKERYVVAAGQGQTLSINITAPGAGLELAVTAASGTVLKTQDATLVWNGTIPANGDYYIDLVNVQGVDKLYTLIVGLITPTTSAFQQVADINSGAGDSNPAYLTVYNNTLYFSANGNDNAGNELWKYDAGTKTASRVVDINPGPDGSNPSYLAPYSNDLYFSANGNDGAGVELWRFNGSAAGRLTDINAGAGDANPMYMTVYNNLLYFSANGNDGAGVELWETDGTTAHRVTDIYGGAGDSNPAYLTVYNNELYFSATSNDGAGTELWKFDGTNASRVADINPGVGNSYPSYLAVYNNLLYFSANGNDGAGVELWKYDASTNTASRAADINSGAGDSIPSYLTVFSNALYFSAIGNDGKGNELWKFDGTTATRVSDINPNGDSNPSYLAVYNNALYFQANNGGGAGNELWKFTGP